MLIEAAGLAVLAKSKADPDRESKAGVGRLTANPAPCNPFLVGILILVFAPSLSFIAGPEPTSRRLSAFNGGLRRNGRMIPACTLVAVGLIVTTDGLVGLIRKG